MALRSPFRVVMLSIVTVATLPGSALGSPTVAEVVAKMQARYNNTKDLKAQFKQVYRDTLYNRARTSWGYLFVKKPGKMRWNYATPEKKAFISDGKRLWVWEPEDRQVFRNPLDTTTLSTGITFLFGAGNLTEEFSITFAKDVRINGSDALQLKLVPRKPTAQYDYLIFAVRKNDYAVVESMIVSQHSTNHFVFKHIVFNSGLGSRRFQFTAPKGTRIIDGRS